MQYLCYSHASAGVAWALLSAIDTLTVRASVARTFVKPPCLTIYYYNI